MFEKDLRTEVFYSPLQHGIEDFCYAVNGKMESPSVVTYDTSSFGGDITQLDYILPLYEVKMINPIIGYDYKKKTVLYDLEDEGFQRSETLPYNVYQCGWGKITFVNKTVGEWASACNI